MKIIALDSSGLVASVAIIEDDNLIAEYNVQYKKTHSQTLLPMLEELRKMVELDMSTVDGVAISKGPGSFTGLRIGSATAKGLCQALNLPIIEIGTLEGMACNLYGTDALVCPMMDARRSQIYTGVFGFSFDANGYKMNTIHEECAMAVDEMCELLCKLSAEQNKNIILLGDGVPVYSDIIEEKLKVPYVIAPAHMNRQRASSFGFLAIDKLKRGETVSFYDHAPEYLRLSQAERERNEGIRNKGSNY